MHLALKGAGHSAYELASVMLSLSAFDVVIYLKYLFRKVIFLSPFFLCTLLKGCLKLKGCAN